MDSDPKKSGNSLYSNDHIGLVYSVEGSIYLPVIVSSIDQTRIRSPHRHHSLYSAKNWLKEQGITNISLHQSNAYFEMIGLDEQTH